MIIVKQARGIRHPLFNMAIINFFPCRILKNSLMRMCWPLFVNEKFNVGIFCVHVILKCFNQIIDDMCGSSTVNTFPESIFYSHSNTYLWLLICMTKTEYNFQANSCILRCCNYYHFFLRYLNVLIVVIESDYSKLIRRYLVECLLSN